MSRSSSMDRAKLPLILLAYEPGEMKEQLLNLLKGMDVDVVAADDGISARLLLKEEKPDLMVVDAAISGVASFELCDFVKKEQLPTRVILIASVFRKTRYKRRPSSLYGADDYVEQHHIHDKLPDKIDALIKGVGLWDSARFVDQELVRRFGDKRLELSEVDGEKARKTAQRLAWIIVSDIALYSPELLSSGEEGITGRALADIEEGRRMFAELVPVEIGSQKDFIGEALNRLRQGRKI